METTSPVGSARKLRELESEWQKYELKVSQRSSTARSFQTGPLTAPTPVGVGMQTPGTASSTKPIGRSSLSKTLSLAAVTPLSASKSRGNGMRGGGWNSRAEGDQIPAVHSSAQALSFTTPPRDDDNALSDEYDPVLQNASSTFVQQVEQLQSRYSARIDELKSDIAKLTTQRDSLAAEIRSASSATHNLDVERVSIQNDLAQATSELERARQQLASLEATTHREELRLEKERSQMLQAVEHEESAMRRRLIAEQSAVEAASEQGRASLEREAAALADRAQRLDIMAEKVAHQDADLFEREAQFHDQMKDITRSLEEREMRLKEAEDIAAKHLQREKDIEVREIIAADQETAAEAALRKATDVREAIEAEEASQACERRRLDAEAAALEERKQALTEEHNRRETDIEERETTLLQATRKFEELCEAQSRQDSEDHERLLAEAQAIELIRDDALARTKAAEIEEKEARDRLAALRAEIHEADNDTSTALASKRAVEKDAQEARHAHQRLIDENADFLIQLERQQGEVSAASLALSEQRAELEIAKGRVDARAHDIDLQESALIAEKRQLRIEFERLSANRQELDQSQSRVAEEAARLAAALGDVEIEKEKMIHRAAECTLQESTILKRLDEREGLLNEFQASLEARSIDIEERRRDTEEQCAGREAALVSKERTVLHHASELESQARALAEKERNVLRDLADREAVLASDEAKVAIRQAELAKRSSEVEMAAAKFAIEQEKFELERESVMIAQAESRRIKSMAELVQNEVVEDQQRLAKRETRIAQMEKETEDAHARIAQQGAELTAAIQRACQRETEANTQLKLAEAKLREAVSRDEKHAAEIERLENVAEEAARRHEEAETTIQRARCEQFIAQSSRAALAGIENALDAREAKLQDSWHALKTGLAELASAPYDSSSNGMELYGPNVLFSDAALYKDAKAASASSGTVALPPLTENIDSHSSLPESMIPALLLRQHALSERETGLQRWAVALQLEASRQAGVARGLRARDADLRTRETGSRDNRDAAEQLLAEVSSREMELQRVAVDLEAADERLKRENAALAEERSKLEAEKTEISNRLEDINKRHARVKEAEHVWGDRLSEVEERETAAADAQRRAAKLQHAAEVREAQLLERETAAADAKAEALQRIKRAEAAEKEASQHAKQLAANEMEYERLKAEAYRDRQDAAAALADARVRQLSAEERSLHLSQLAEDLDSRLLEAAGIEQRAKALRDLDAELTTREHVLITQMELVQKDREDAAAVRQKLEVDMEHIQLLAAGLEERSVAIENIERDLSRRIEAADASEMRDRNRSEQLEELSDEILSQKKQLDLENRAVSELKVELELAKSRDDAAAAKMASLADLERRLAERESEVLRREADVAATESRAAMVAQQVTSLRQREDVVKLQEKEIELAWAGVSEAQGKLQEVESRSAELDAAQESLAQREARVKDDAIRQAYESQARADALLSQLISDRRSLDEQLEDAERQKEAAAALKQYADDRMTGVDSRLGELSKKEEDIERRNMALQEREIVLARQMSQLQAERITWAQGEPGRKNALAQADFVAAEIEKLKISSANARREAQEVAGLEASLRESQQALERRCKVLEQREATLQKLEMECGSLKDREAALVDHETRVQHMERAHKLQLEYASNVAAEADRRLQDAKQRKQALRSKEGQILAKIENAAADIERRQQQAAVAEAAAAAACAEFTAREESIARREMALTERAEGVIALRERLTASQEESLHRKAGAKQPASERIVASPANATSKVLRAREEAWWSLDELEGERAALDDFLERVAAGAPAANLAAQTTIPSTTLPPSLESISEAMVRGAGRLVRLEGILHAIVQAGTADPTAVAASQVTLQSLRSELTTIRAAVGVLAQKHGNSNSSEHSESAIDTDGHRAILVRWEAGLGKALEAVVGIQRAALASRPPS